MVAEPLKQVHLDFAEDEDLDLDTTAQQHANGKDLQGIPWSLTQWTRDAYRVSAIGVLTLGSS
jgi:hypothetical protein